MRVAMLQVLRRLQSRGLKNRMQWVSSSMMSSTEKCWKCGSVLQNKDLHLFCNCSENVVLPPHADDYFVVFGLTKTMEIETRQLSSRFRELQSLLHPDKFSRKCQEEQLFSAQQSAFVNRAYQTLLDPLSRGLYLLEEHGLTIEEGETQIETDFLSEVMDLNELAAEASAEEDIKELLTTIRGKTQQCWQTAVEAYSKDDMVTVRRSLVRMRYYRTTEETLGDKTIDFKHN